MSEGQSRIWRRARCRAVGGDDVGGAGAGDAVEVLRRIWRCWGGVAIGAGAEAVVIAWRDYSIEGRMTSPNGRGSYVEEYKLYFRYLLGRDFQVNLLVGRRTDICMLHNIRYRNVCAGRF
jgi:hypothetical protein